MADLTDAEVMQQLQDQAKVRPEHQALHQKFVELAQAVAATDLPPEARNEVLQKILWASKAFLRAGVVTPSIPAAVEDGPSPRRAAAPVNEPARTPAPQRAAAPVNEPARTPAPQRAAAPVNEPARTPAPQRAAAPRPAPAAPAAPRAATTRTAQPAPRQTRTPPPKGPPPKAPPSRRR